MSKSSSTNRKARAQIYREAAAYIERTRFVGCYALQMVMDTQTYGGSAPIFATYKDFFKPDVEPWVGGWWGSLPLKEAAGCRVLAFGFLAAMVEAGDA